MDEIDLQLHKYKIQMKQVRKTVLTCIARDEDEAKYIAELASKGDSFYHLDWDRNDFYFDFISSSPCLYVDYRKAAFSEWIRKKKRQGYSFKAVLKGALDQFEFETDLTKDIVWYTWHMDGNEKERKILRDIYFGKKDNESFDFMAKYISIDLKIDEKEAKELLDLYWFDDEHPLDDSLDYGDDFERTDYWY